MVKLILDKYIDNHDITRYELSKRTGIRFQIIDNYYKKEEAARLLPFFVLHNSNFDLAVG